MNQWYVDVRPPDENFPMLMNKLTVSWYVFGNGTSQSLINELIEYMGFEKTMVKLPKQKTYKFIKAKVDVWLANEGGNQ